MTPLEAGVLRAANTYCALGYGLSEHEVQKLAYFLQEAGEALNKREGAVTQEQVLAAVRAWNERKRSLMVPEHVAAAWGRLEQAGWLH